MPPSLLLSLAILIPGGAGAACVMGPGDGSDAANALRVVAPGGFFGMVIEAHWWREHHPGARPGYRRISIKGRPFDVAEAPGIAPVWFDMSGTEAREDGRAHGEGDPCPEPSWP